MTDAERRLWQRLRLRQPAGRRFRRQYAVGPYIADFVCIEARLIIEVDGGQHLESASDACRDALFEVRGYRVLRCWNHDVLNRTDDVLTAILEALASDGPRPNLPPRAGEGVKT